MVDAEIRRRLFREAFRRRLGRQSLEYRRPAFTQAALSDVLSEYVAALDALESTSDAGGGASAFESVAEGAELLVEATALETRDELRRLAASAATAAGFAANASTLLRAEEAATPAPEALAARTTLAYEALLRRSFRWMGRVAAVPQDELRLIMLELETVPRQAGKASASLRLLRGVRFLADALMALDDRANEVEAAFALFARAREIALRTEVADVYSQTLDFELQARLALENSTARLLAPYVRDGILRSDLLEVLVSGHAGSTYPRYELWPPQRDFLEEAFRETDNFVAEMPTSAGKTTLAELLIARWLSENPSAQVVYLAPLNALAYELRDTLGQRFSAVARVDIQTGSYDIVSAESADSAGARILVTTPERFDGFLRGRALEESYGLTACHGLVVDEVHLLGSASRGITIEHAISRFRAIFPAAQVFAISGVLGTPGVVSTWISRDRIDRHFSRRWRPTRIREGVWRRDGNLEFRDGSVVSGIDRHPALKLGDAIGELVGQLLTAGWGPAMVLADKRNCPSLAEKVAASLSERERPSRETVARRERLAARIEQVYWEDFRLANLVRDGVAFHHADLDPRVQTLITDDVRAAEPVLRTVVATTTLAEGVNLAFRLIVFHTTQVGGGLPPALYRNVVGRVARAYRATEGLVLFVATERQPPAWIARKFWGLRRRDLAVGSPTLAFGFSEEAVLRARASLSLESQILGHIADGTLPADAESESITARTLIPIISPDEVGPAEQRVSQLTNAMLSQAVPPVQRESAARLTSFGKACLRTGLSTTTCEFFRAGIATRLDADAAALEEFRDEDDEIRSAIFDFLLTHTVRAPEAFVQSEARRALSDDEVAAHLLTPGNDLTRPEPDAALVAAWVRGHSMEDVWRAHKPSAARESAALNGENYVTRVQRQFAWIYFGFLSILGYALDEEGAVSSPELPLFYGYLRRGVDNPVALRLVEWDPSVAPRETAVAVTRRYPLPFTGLESEQESVEWLGGLGIAELSAAVGEERAAAVYDRIHSVD